LRVPASALARLRPAAASLGLLALLVLVGAASALAGRPLVDGASLQSMAFQLPEFGLLTVAMALTMLAGGINLAVVAMANLSAIVAALLVTGGGGSSLALGSSIVLGLAVGTLAGIINGIAIAWLRITAVLATLCTMLIYAGLGILLSGGGAITGLPGAMMVAANSTLFGVPAILVLFLVAAAALAFLLLRTPFGPELRATGLNEAAARFSGIDTRRILIATYALSGLFSALAGLVMLGRFNSAKAGYGDSYLLATLLAAVLGGISPDGGKGTILGLVTAVIVLQATSSTLNVLDVNPYVTPIAWGIILILKLGWDRYRPWRG
jgi:simple sugar transport system permease protein